MKFSIIIPVYNTEKYVERCIESVLKQTYNNFEIIIINDGSQDNSEKILTKYNNNLKIKIIKQSNHGLSYSRNIGVTKSTGDYILFLDSDDLIEPNLLKILKENITNEEMIKFSYCDYKNNVKYNNETIEFKNLAGKESFIKLSESKTLFEMACIYAYKRDYMLKFSFEEGKYHEDHGLIPIMIYYSKNISSINYCGYIYNRDNDTSITSFTDEEKEYKKALDVLYFFKKIKETEKDEYLLSFYSNAVLLKLTKLYKEYKKAYKKEIKKEQVCDYLLTDNLKRKFKKMIYKLII